MRGLDERAHAGRLAPVDVEDNDDLPQAQGCDGGAERANGEEQQQGDCMFGAADTISVIALAQILGFGFSRLENDEPRKQGMACRIAEKCRVHGKAEGRVKRA